MGKSVMIRLAGLLLLVTVPQSVFAIELDNLGTCVQQQPTANLLSCFGHQALVTLQSFDDADNFTLASGLVMVKDESTMTLSRSLPNFLDQDPTDFKGILENAGIIIGQRSLRWDLGVVEPGLFMRVGPSAGAASMLEFAIDGNPERNDRAYLSHEPASPPSTARILSRKLLVPFLLGLKFNMATLLPIVFGALIFVSKKAVLLSKIAVFITTLFGAGQFFSLGSLFGGESGYGYGGGYRPPPGYGLSGGYSGSHYHHPPPHGYHAHDDYYKAASSANEKADVAQTTPPKAPQRPSDKPSVDRFYDYEKKVMHRDQQSKLFERELDDDDAANVGGGGGDGGGSGKTSQTFRHFAWQTI